MDDHHRKSRTRERSSYRRHHRTVAAGEKAVHGSHYARPEENHASVSRPMVPVHHILREKIQEPLANEEDYVHRWLAKTATEIPEVELHKSSRYERNADFAAPSKHTPAKVPKFPKFLQDKAHDVQGVRPDGDVDRRFDVETSSGSSFLERGHAPEPKISRNHREQETEGDELEPDIPVFSQEKRKRKRTPSPAIEVVSDSSDQRPKETFERRARHKTKEDRYDPRKRIEKTKKERKSKSKNEKKGERSKMLKNAGDTLMQNFESHKVGNDRLTIRPSHKLGLFKNGRASSPGRRRGLPDLAFSEMEFLQRSNRRPEVQSQKAPPKRNNKDRRREERVFNEISSYFTAGKEPLGEIDPNQRHLDKSNVRGQPDSVYEQPRRRQATTESVYEDALRRHDTLPDFPDFMEKPFLGFGRQASIPSKNRTFERETLGRESTEKATDTASKASGPVTSYLSWSESAVPPDDVVEPVQQRNYDDGTRSSTPESVREALARTGVFKDTGIHRYSLPTGAGSNIRARFRELQEDAERSSRLENSLSQTEAPQNPESLQRPIEDLNHAGNVMRDELRPNRGTGMRSQQKDFDLSRFRANAPQPTEEVSRGPIKEVPVNQKPRAELEVFHFDAEKGWHQAKMDQAQGDFQSPVITNPARSESARLNRHELAQTAYIRPQSRSALKRPETRQAGEDKPRSLRFPERPSMLVRPTSAPAGTSIPVTMRPHSAAARMRTEIPNHEVPQREVLANIGDQASASKERPQMQPHRSIDNSSLPPLTDRVSVSSLRRTVSTPSTQQSKIREQFLSLQNQFPDKPQVEDVQNFSLPVRGAWTPQDIAAHSGRRASPAIIIADSLYGQQIEEMPLNEFQDFTPSEAFNSEFRTNGRDDLDFAREEAFIQGLSYEIDANQSMVQYQDYGYLETMDEFATNIDAAVDNGEYYEDQPYVDGNTEASFRNDGFEEQVDNQENMFTGNDLNEWNGEPDYELASHQEYLGEEIFRNDVVEMDEGESLVGFWRPHQQY